MYFIYRYTTSNIYICNRFFTLINLKGEMTYALKVIIAVTKIKQNSL